MHEITLATSKNDEEKIPKKVCFKTFMDESCVDGALVSQRAHFKVDPARALHGKIHYLC